MTEKCQCCGADLPPKCGYCGAEMPNARKGQKYCSGTHRKAAFDERKKIEKSK